MYVYGLGLGLASRIWPSEDCRRPAIVEYTSGKGEIGGRTKRMGMRMRASASGRGNDHSFLMQYFFLFCFRPLAIRVNDGSISLSFPRSAVR